MLVVHRLAGVLLEMEPFDADVDFLEPALGVGADRDHDGALADDRLLVLRNLVALRQVRVEIVLPVEHGFEVDPGLQPKAGADRLPHAFLVDDRQHPRHRRVDEADIVVRLGAELRRRSGEQLRLRQHLGVDLHADDDFPVAGSAGNEAFGIGRARVDEAHCRWLAEPGHRRKIGPFTGRRRVERSLKRWLCSCGSPRLPFRSPRCAA